MIENDNKNGSRVFLKGINYFTGELKDISNVENLKNNPAKLESYYKMGLKTYAETDLSMLEMAYYCIKKTLEEIDISPLEIDILLYVAESKGRDEAASSGEVNALLNYLGMGNTYPVGIYLSDCANVLMGLQTAHSMVMNGQARNVMVVSTNKYPKGKSNTRLMNPEVAVCSDGAVSALVTSTGGDFEMIGAKKIKNEASGENAPPLDVSIKKIKALRTVSKSLLSEIGLTNNDIAKVYVNNYYELSQIFVESCGFKADKGYYENLSKYGHCLAGDTVINLKDQKDAISDGDNILLIADGPYGSFVVCLQKT